MLIPDSYRYQGLRKRMVDELRVHGLLNERVLDAIRAVPRHQFFQDVVFVEKAYQDIAFQIGAGQTISHPSTVAIQTQLLDLIPGEKVLEIGTGSGYQTAVLAQFNIKIFSIERQHTLYLRTKKLLEEMNVPARLFFGDGYLGQPVYAPYDKIIVTAGAPSIPQALIDQLKPGGRMVIPVGQDGKQIMHVLDKNIDGTIAVEEHGEFRFVPLLERKN